MTVPVVRGGGTPKEVGLAHGSALAAPLRAFLADGLARLDHLLPEPVSLGSLAPLLAAYRAEIASALPALAQELAGLADGAGVSADEALLLQVRREILGYRRIPARGDCTTYARPGLLAQTVDLNGDLDDQLAVLDVAPAGAHRSLVLSFGGLLGYLGLNRAGLAVGLNLVLGGEWRPGVPPYLAIRHLLDTASTVESAIAVLAGLRLASSRSIMLCDAESVAYVEILGDEQRVVRAPHAVHTNHFLHSDLAPGDELNVFARNSSRLRLEAGAAGLDATTVEQHFAVLATEPVRVAGNGDIRRERTVAAVVLDPVRGELHLRPGDPATSTTQVIRFD